MRTVTSAYREKVNSGEALHLKANLFSADLETMIALSEDRFMEGATFTGGSCPSGEFTVGGCVISSFRFVLNNWSGTFDDFDFAGAFIEPYLGHTSGSFVDNDDQIKIGRYYIASHKTYGHTIACVAYDALKLMDQTPLSLTYPITAADAVEAIADNHGMSVTGTIPSITLTDPGEDMTERLALSYISALCGKFVSITSNNRITFKWYDGTALEKETIFSEEIELADITITGVKHGSTMIGTDGYVIDLSDNPFITSANITTVLQNAGAIIGTSFRPGNVSILADPSIEEGDLITFESQAGETVTMPVTTYVYKLGVSEEVGCDAETPDELDLRVSAYTVARNAQGAADTANANALEASQKVDDLEIGGINLLPDSNRASFVRVAGTAARYLSDSWQENYVIGAFVKISDPPAAGIKYGYRLNCRTASSSRSQRGYAWNHDQTESLIKVVPGETYTVSCYVRKISGTPFINQRFGYSKNNGTNWLYSSSSFEELTSTNWKHIHYTFTYPSDITNRGSIYAIQIATNSVGMVEACGFKLEKGTKPTEWSLSQADINADAEQEGGRNLLLSTGTPVERTIALNASNYMTIDAYKTIAPVPQLFDEGDYLTISFDWETNATNGAFRVECGTVTPYVWGSVVESSGGRSPDTQYVDFASGVTFGHFVITYRVSSGVDTATNNLQWLRIRIDGENTAGKTIKISNAKVERGKNATDWTPAPEDIDADITAVETIANNAMTAANGKNKIFHQSTEPTGTFIEGDTWFDTANDYAMYTWDGTAWVLEQFGEDSIAANAIKAGHIDAGAITADKIAAKTITAKQLSLGDFTNLATVNENNPASMHTEYSNGKTTIIDGYIAKLDASKNYLMLNSNRTASDFKDGDELYFEFTAHAESSVTTKFKVYAYNASDANISSLLSQSDDFTIGTTDATITGTVTLESSSSSHTWTEAVTYLICISNNLTNVQVYLKNVLVHKKSGGELIADEITGKTITGSKLRTTADHLQVIESTPASGAFDDTGVYTSGDAYIEVDAAGMYSIPVSAPTTKRSKLQQARFKIISGGSTSYFWGWYAAPMLAAERLFMSTGEAISGYKVLELINAVSSPATGVTGVSGVVWGRFATLFFSSFSYDPSVVSLTQYTLNAAYVPELRLDLKDTLNDVRFYIYSASDNSQTTPAGCIKPVSTLTSAKAFRGTFTYIRANNMASSLI